MSGPKTSRYTLTAEQRRILAEQRKIERHKAVATETIKRTEKRLLQIGGKFGTDKQIATELFARTGSDNGMGTLLTELDISIFDYYIRSLLIGIVHVDAKTFGHRLQ